MARGRQEKGQGEDKEGSETGQNSERNQKDKCSPAGGQGKGNLLSNPSDFLQRPCLGLGRSHINREDLWKVSLLSEGYPLSLLARFLANPSSFFSCFRKIPVVVMVCVPLQLYLLPSDHHRGNCPVDICSRQTVLLPLHQSTSGCSFACGDCTRCWSRGNTSTERPRIGTLGKKRKSPLTQSIPSVPERLGLLYRATGCQTPDPERIKEGDRVNHFYLVV